MKKANDVAKMLASALLSDGKIWDESAETTQEIARKIGLSESQVLKKIRGYIKAGQMEKVWRRVNGNPIPAYRVKQ